MGTVSLFGQGPDSAGRPSYAARVVTHNPTDRHGHIPHLSEQEFQDLMAFLLSLEGDKSRVQDLERVG